MKKTKSIKIEETKEKVNPQVTEDFMNLIESSTNSDCVFIVVGRKDSEAININTRGFTHVQLLNLAELIASNYQYKLIKNG